MANCQGCGRYVGDYSGYRYQESGKDDIVLCYKCKRWADSHPGQNGFPRHGLTPATDVRRVRTFATIYVISALGLFALGVLLVVSRNWFKAGALFVLGAFSLFFIGRGMRKSSRQ